MLDSFVVVLGAGVVATLLPSAYAQEATAAACPKDEAGNEVCPEASAGDQPKLPGGLPVAAQVAIAVVVVTVVLLSITMFWCIRRSRRASEEASQDVMVEASQVTGPPAILAATYTPETGHSKIYSIGLDTGGMTGAMSGAPQPSTPAAPASAFMSARAPATPAYPATPAGASPMPSAAPVTAEVGSAKPSMFSRFAALKSSGLAGTPMTAPAHKANFSDQPYPFTGHGNSGSGSTVASPVQPRSAYPSNGGFPRPLMAGRLKDRIRERPPSISSLTNVPSSAK